MFMCCHHNNTECHYVPLILDLIEMRVFPKYMVLPKTHTQ